MKKNEQLVTSYFNKQVILTKNGRNMSGTITEKFGQSNFYFNELILDTGINKKNRFVYITRYYEGTMTEELRQKAIVEFQIRERIEPVKGKK